MTKNEARGKGASDQTHTHTHTQTHVISRGMNEHKADLEGEHTHIYTAHLDGEHTHTHKPAAPTTTTTTCPRNPNPPPSSYMIYRAEKPWLNITSPNAIHMHYTCTIAHTTSHAHMPQLIHVQSQLTTHTHIHTRHITVGCKQIGTRNSSNPTAHTH